MPRPREVLTFGLSCQVKVWKSENKLIAQLKEQADKPLSQREVVVLGAFKVGMDHYTGHQEVKSTSNSYAAKLADMEEAVNIRNAVNGMLQGEELFGPVEGAPGAWIMQKSQGPVVKLECSCGNTKDFARNDEGATCTPCSENPEDPQGKVTKRVSMQGVLTATIERQKRDLACKVTDVSILNNMYGTTDWEAIYNNPIKWFKLKKVVVEGYWKVQDTGLVLEFSKEVSEPME